MSQAFTGKSIQPSTALQRVLEDVRMYCAVCFATDKSTRTANTIVRGTAVCWQHMEQVQNEPT